jgi:hypothetical protein
MLVLFVVQTGMTHIRQSKYRSDNRERFFTHKGSSIESTSSAELARRAKLRAAGEQNIIKKIAANELEINAYQKK